MVRSAAKNYHDVTIVVDQADYDEVLAQIKEDGETSLATRARLAAKAFRHTAAYDSLISQYLTKQTGLEDPEKLTLSWDLKETMRYGYMKTRFLRLFQFYRLNNYMVRSFPTIILKMLMKHYGAFANLMNQQL